MMASKRLGSVSSVFISVTSGASRKPSVLVSTVGRSRMRPPESSESTAINSPALAVVFRRSPRRRPGPARSGERRSPARRSPFRGVGDRYSFISHASFFEHRPVRGPVNPDLPIRTDYRSVAGRHAEAFSFSCFILHSYVYGSGRVK